MHFHDLGQCQRCGVFATYLTPMPQILILSSRCNACGEWDMVGRYPDAFCLDCDTAHWKDTGHLHAGPHQPS